MKSLKGKKTIFQNKKKFMIVVFLLILILLSTFILFKLLLSNLVGENIQEVENFTSDVINSKELPHLYGQSTPLIYPFSYNDAIIVVGDTTKTYEFTVSYAQDIRVEYDASIVTVRYDIEDNPIEDDIVKVKITGKNKGNFTVKIIAERESNSSSAFAYIYGKVNGTTSNGNTEGDVITYPAATVEYYNDDIFIKEGEYTDRGFINFTNVDISRCSLSVDDSNIADCEFGYVNNNDDVMDYIRVTGKEEGNTVVRFNFGNYGGSMAQITWNVTVNKKIDPPTCKITAEGNLSSGSITNKKEITYTITFSDDVEGFTKEDITLEGGTISEFNKVNNSKYNVKAKSKEGTYYNQKIKVNSNVCNVSGTDVGNKTSNSLTLCIDTKAPTIENVSITSNTKFASKNSIVTITFDLIDDFSLNHDTSKEIDKSNMHIYVKDGEKREYCNDANVKVTKTGVSSANKQSYTATITNITNDYGTIDFTISPIMSGYDVAGNQMDTYIYSGDKSTTNQTPVIVDNIPAKLETIKYNQTNGNVINNNIYIKNGGQIVIWMQFSKKITTAPVVTIINKSSAIQSNKVINPSGNMYVATYTIPANEEKFNEGELSINIANFTAENGLSGDPVTKTVDSNNMKLIYDRTAPTIDDEDIIYSHEPDNAESPDWRNSQTVTITAHDNFTIDSKIDCTYLWSKNNEDGEYKSGINGKTITKNEGTGIYYLRINYTDLAGNIKTKNLGPFYLDTEVSDTEMGKLVATKKDGTKYQFEEKQYENGTIYYEGPYLSDDIYITKEDGGVNEGNESGHSKTTYDVKQITKAENGEYVEVDTTVGSDTKGHAILYHNYDYKVRVTTEDKATPKNVRTVEYIIHKGANITFSPNGTTSPVAKQNVVVTLTDENNDYSKISYAWVEAKDGEEPTTPTKWTNSTDINGFKKGKTVSSPTGVDGKYYLYVKTEDTNGNVNIVRSECYELLGKIQNPGIIEFRENDESGEELLPDESNIIRTKENVWVNIKNQGSDKNGNVKTTFGITKANDGTEIGTSTLERAELNDEGKYTLTLTSKRTNTNNPSLDTSCTTKYTIIVDKTSPNVTFERISDDNAKVGQIKVKIDDNGDKENEKISKVAQTGVKKDTLRYYWTNGNYTPTKEDFYGPENEYRGIIKSTTQTINTPSNVSGIWVLWVYAEDNVGNVTIVQERQISDNDTVTDNDVPIAGTLKMTTIEENGEEKEYVAGTKNDAGEVQEVGKFTNKDVKIELLPGYDSISGISSNTYTIAKENGELVAIDGKTKFDGVVTLTEHGIYTATVTTIDNAQGKNKSTRVYIIKIDKNGPQITFTPDGNKEYAKQHTIQVSVTEPETESGVNTSKTQYVWLGYNPEVITSKEDLINKVKEFVKGKGRATTEKITNIEFIKKLVTQENIKELEKLGIYVSTTEVGQTIKTPEGKTGIYCLGVYAEDNIGNSEVLISNGYYIDNTNPTKPDIRGIKKQVVGTQEKDVDYYGEKTNKEVTVITENSKSLSGVDKYEYTYTKDNGKTWSEWKDGTFKETIDEKEIIKGKAIIADHGVTVVKFRSIAELIDGTLVSEETDEFTVVIDKKGPEVTFENTENGENGSKESIKSIKVRPTVTDEAGIAEHTLKYSWVKFESVEEFNKFKEKERTIEDLKEKMGEGAKNFSNGEPIPSPEGIEGIYSLFIYAEDKEGNASINYSQYYAFNLTKEEDKNAYILQGEYITRVLPETKVESFKEKVKNIIAGSSYTVYDKEGKELTKEDYVTTASSVEVNGNKYTIIVVGDLNGDGKLTGTDIVRMRFSRVGKFELVGAYEKAADINNDGKVTGTDLVRMRLINVGLADYTE